MLNGPLLIQKESKKRRGVDYHVIFLGVEGYDTSTTLLTNLDKEQIIFMVGMTSPISTQLGK